MPDDKSISVVNLGPLSKSADTLIKKVSSAVGGLFEPWQIERVAKAQAKADLIKAQSEIQITDLHRRAMHRFVEEEAQRQAKLCILPLVGGKRTDKVAYDAMRAAKHIGLKCIPQKETLAIEIAT
jgi:hypothetical protein